MSGQSGTTDIIVDSVKATTGTIATNTVTTSNTTTANITTANITTANITTATIQKISTITAPLNVNTTLLASQSGSIILLGQVTVNSTITLPAVSAGLNFTFLLTNTTDDAHHWVISGAGGTPIIGMIMTLLASPNTNKVIAAALSLTQSNTAANSRAGDRIEMVCDGTNWSTLVYTSGAAAGWA